VTPTDLPAPWWRWRHIAALARTWATPRAALLAALYALAALLWLPYHIARKAMPIPSFFSEAAAAALGLLALGALLPYAARLPLPRVIWLPFGFVLLLLLQLALGLPATTQQAQFGALYLLWAAGLMVLAALLRRELGLERVATVLAWALFAGALASGAVSLAQILESYDLLGALMVVSSRGRVWANLAQPNHLADYLGLGLASIAFLYATGRLRLVYALAAGLLVCVILSVTGSRAAALYILAIAGLGAGYFALERDAAGRRLALFGAFAVAVYAAAILAGPIPGTMGALQRPGLQGSAPNAHAALWHAGWAMFLDAPWLGQGFRQYGFRYFMMAPELPQPLIGGFNDHAHNLVLQVMAEFGLVGVALLAAGLAPWIIGLLRQRRTPALWWLCAAAAVLGLHSLLEYPLWYTFFLGPAALVLGLAEARTLELRPAAARAGRVRAALAAMLLLGWAVLVPLVRDYLFIENFAGLRFKYLHATREWDRQARATLLEMHRGSLLSPWVTLGLARSINIDRERLPDKLALNTAVLHVFPIDDVVYRQAMLLALSGDQEGARRQWDRATTVFPGERAAAILVLRRRVEDGLEELRALLEYAQSRG
jgi:O-antigen ligase